MLQVSGSGRDRCLTNTFWLESITGFYYPDTLIRRAEYTVNIFLSVSHTKSLSQKSVKNVKRFRQLIMTPFLITNHQPLFHMCITLPVKSAPFFIPPTSFCSVLLVHLILRISPHHSHHFRSHHLSLPLPFTPDLKLISFTDPFLRSHSYSFRTDCAGLKRHCFVLVSGYVC